MDASTDIDTEMYLRDGMPHATVCKVQLRDGRIGIGIFRQDPSKPGALEGAAADAAARDDALQNVPAPDDPDGDLQASLGHKAQ